MAYEKFDKDSQRSIAGLKFQSRVLDMFRLAYPSVEFEMTWDYFKSMFPSYDDKKLSHLEKEYGDITYELNGERHYIECCFVMGERYSRMCEMKRLKFNGENKWYCYGFNGTSDIIMIPSQIWNRYVSKITKRDVSHRMVPIYAIKGLRAGIHNIGEYWKECHKIS